MSAKASKEFVLVPKDEWDQLNIRDAERGPVKSDNTTGPQCKKRDKTTVKSASTRPSNGKDWIQY